MDVHYRPPGRGDGGDKTLPDQTPACSEAQTPHSARVRLDWLPVH